MLGKLAQMRKALVAGVGVVLAVLVAANQVGDLLPPSWQPWITGALVVLTPIATWLIPNKKPAAA